MAHKTSCTAVVLRSLVFHASVFQFWPNNREARFSDVYTCAPQEWPRSGQFGWWRATCPQPSPRPNAVHRDCLSRTS